MKSVLNDFANDTDADLAAYVQMYRTRIADRTEEIEVMMRGPIDEEMRDAIARLKWEQGEERERLEQIKDEQPGITMLLWAARIITANRRGDSGPARAQRCWGFVARSAGSSLWRSPIIRGPIVKDG